MLVSSAIRDITERRAAENEVRHSRAILQGLFESLPGLFLVFTPDLKIVSISDALLEATRTKREEVLGRSIFEVFPDQPGSTAIAEWRASLDRVRQTAAPDTMAIQKYDIRRPDGVLEERYWSPIELPVLGTDQADLEYFIHRVVDVARFVQRKSQFGSRPTRPLTLRGADGGRDFPQPCPSRATRPPTIKLHDRHCCNYMAKADAETVIRSKSTFLSTMSHEIRTA